MKLLLDEMWSAEAAIQLRLRGHDAIAVTERPELRGQPDPAVFAAAQAEGRVIVTENVSDYRPLALSSMQHGCPHAGLIFTSNRSFPRHHPRTIGRLISALDALLSRECDLENSEYWLS